MKRHVVLVGLPGAGKTTAGRLAAAQLGASFTDLDEVIAERAGMPVPGIFADRGEAGFRALEREAMEELLATAPRVIAPGGGWAAREGALAAARPRALTVHLRVSPETAASEIIAWSDGVLNCSPTRMPARISNRRRKASNAANAAIPAMAISVKRRSVSSLRLARTRS